MRRRFVWEHAALESRPPLSSRRCPDLVRRILLARSRAASALIGKGAAAQSPRGSRYRWEPLFGNHPSADIV